MEPEKKSTTKLVNAFAFFTMAIIATLIILENVLGLTGTFVYAMKTAESVLMLLTLGISAFNFVKDKEKGWKIAYWIIIAIYVAAIAFIWIFAKK